MTESLCYIGGGKGRVAFTSRPDPTTATHGYESHWRDCQCLWLWHRTDHLHGPWASLGRDVTYDDWTGVLRVDDHEIPLHLVGFVQPDTSAEFHDLYRQQIAELHRLGIRVFVLPTAGDTFELCYWMFVDGFRLPWRVETSNLLDSTRPDYYLYSNTDREGDLTDWPDIVATLTADPLYRLVDDRRRIRAATTALLEAHNLTPSGDLVTDLNLLTMATRLAPDRPEVAVLADRFATTKRNS